MAEGGREENGESVARSRREEISGREQDLEVSYGIGAVECDGQV